MCDRENLIWEYADDLDPDEKVYRTADVNEVMDQMEARINKLETKLAKEKAYSHSLREELSNYNELYKH